MSITATKKSQIYHHWHLIDLKDQVLGRISTRIAEKLMGKTKPYFVRHLDCGDFVVAINAKNIVVTGRKKTQKKYYRHSGYAGGFKELTFEQLHQKDPRKIIIHAVKNMLPQNKLRQKMLARLKVFADDNHPYQDKFTSKKSTR
jgi:large subunit ribosomal protein L13